MLSFLQFNFLFRSFVINFTLLLSLPPGPECFINTRGTAEEDRKDEVGADNTHKED